MFFKRITIVSSRVDLWRPRGKKMGKVENTFSPFFPCLFWKKMGKPHFLPIFPSFSGPSYLYSRATDTFLPVREVLICFVRWFSSICIQVESACQTTYFPKLVPKSCAPSWELYITSRELPNVMNLRSIWCYTCLHCVNCGEEAERPRFLLRDHFLESIVERNPCNPSLQLFHRLGDI